jgi:hypothetical protein
MSNAKQEPIEAATHYACMKKSWVEFLGEKLIQLQIV